MAEGLFFNLNFSSDNTKLKDFVKSIGDLNAKSVLAGFGMAGLYEVTSKILDQADKNALSLNNFAGMTGQSTQQMQKFDTAAQEAGVSAGVFSQSVDNLLMQQAKLKNGIPLPNAGAWAMLGLSTDIQKETDLAKLVLKVIQAARDKFPNDIGRQRSFLSAVGIGDSLILMKGSYADIQKNIANSAQDLAKMKEYHSSITEFSRQWDISMTTIGGTLSSLILPPLKAINMLMGGLGGERYSKTDIDKTLGQGIMFPGMEFAGLLNPQAGMMKNVYYYITQHIATDKPKDAADESHRQFKRAAAQTSDQGN